MVGLVTQEEKQQASDRGYLSHSFISSFGSDLVIEYTVQVIHL